MKSATSADIVIPTGLDTSVVRVLLTGPGGDVLAGRFTGARAVRVDKVWVLLVVPHCAASGPITVKGPSGQTTTASFTVVP